MRCLNIVLPTAKEIRLLRVGLSGMILHFSDHFFCGNSDGIYRMVSDNISSAYVIFRNKTSFAFSDLDSGSQLTTAASVSNACRIERKLSLRSREVYRPIQHLGALPGEFYYYSEKQCIRRTSFISYASAQYAVRLAALVGPLT